MRCDAMRCGVVLSDPGNHEEYTGQADEWAEFVAERGFTVLEVSFCAPFMPTRTTIEVVAFFFLAKNTSS